ncbi:MAG: hypothetical protein F9K29_20270 [Hyphomicrobiaceae bacterium]|nr:MAG: hypothetical protein F9K29_20270 [Hyphomicrobiaceae bacterium]
MSDDKLALSERKEIEMLLPWYVTGRLDAKDRARVEAYLARDPAMRRQLDLIREEQAEDIGANEVLGTAPAGALERLMASLPERRPGLAQRVAAGRLYEAVVDFFTAPTARGVRLAAIVAAVLVLVQAAVITTLIVRGDNAGAYQTASGQETGEGIPLLVTFTDEARAPAIAGLLRDLDATIVDGPKPGGLYKIRVRTADRSEAASLAVQRRLTDRRDVVKSVLPAKD